MIDETPDDAFDAMRRDLEGLIKRAQEMLRYSQANIESISKSFTLLSDAIVALDRRITALETDRRRVH